ncbi:MAG: hypothetical protein AB7S38_14465 [Vulcanimicrobiota bacterium]
MSVGEWFTLLGVGLENSLYNLRLDLKEARVLGRERWWWRLRLARRLTYPRGPFGLARREGRASELSENDCIYGETPILTAWQLLQELRAGPEDHLVELGCGRANLLFVGALAFGCQGSGQEVMGGFVDRCSLQVRRLGLEGLTFEQRNYLDGPLPQGTLYFLSPTTLEDDSWKTLQTLMHEAPSGARCVTLSSPLPKLAWTTLSEQSRNYSWGSTRVFIQQRL